MHPRRHARLPILLYCEGRHDAAFIKYLHSVYGHLNLRNSFDIKAGSGGSPISLIRKAERVVGAYESRIVKFDDDRGAAELLAAQKLKTDVRLCFCTPCIESTLLETLNPNVRYSHLTTQRCKQLFHSQYISESERSNPQRYATLFPKKLLNSSRSRVAQLDTMISIIQFGDRWISEHL